MLELLALAQQCAPVVAPETMMAIAKVESTFNPYAIGVVNGALKRQPTTKAEALATVAELERQGRNFSIGLVQVNRHNLPKYRLSYADAFEPCQNLRVGGLILQECYARAIPGNKHPQQALRAAFSCYYSGNFIRGFRPDAPGQLSYVDKVVAAATQSEPAAVRVPRIEPAAGRNPGLAPASPVVTPRAGRWSANQSVMVKRPSTAPAGEASAGASAPAGVAVSAAEAARPSIEPSEGRSLKKAAKNVVVDPSAKVIF